MCVCILSGFSCNSVTLWTTRFLSPWDSPGKNSGVGCHVLLLQQIFPSQGVNPSFLYLLLSRWVLYY